jgi:hypothetical protein
MASSRLFAKDLGYSKRGVFDECVRA